MKKPAMIIPEAMQPIQNLMAATQKSGVAPSTLGLVHLRASQNQWLQFLHRPTSCLGQLRVSDGTIQDQTTSSST